MLLQIKEATELMSEIAQLGYIFKMLVALVFLLLFSVGYLFKLLLSEIRASHAREKATVEVLTATNNILDRMMREDANIRHEISELRTLVLTMRPIQPL